MFSFIKMTKKIKTLKKITLIPAMVKDETYVFVQHKLNSQKLYYIHFLNANIDFIVFYMTFVKTKC